MTFMQGRSTTNFGHQNLFQVDLNVDAARTMMILDIITCVIIRIFIPEITREVYKLIDKKCVIVLIFGRNVNTSFSLILAKGFLPHISMLRGVFTNGQI